MEKTNLRKQTSRPGIPVGVFAIIALLCAWTATSRADFNGDDTLATGTGWSAFLQTGTGAQLLFQNNRAEFVVTGGSVPQLNAVGYAWVETTGSTGTSASITTPITGSYVKDWSVQVNAYLDKLTLSSGGDFGSISLMVMNSANSNDIFTAKIGRYKTKSKAYYSAISSEIAPYISTISPPIPYPDFGVNNSMQETTLKISFDSATKTLTSYYSDGIFIEGNRWKQIRSVDIANNNYGWNMPSDGTFIVLLTGSASGTNSINSGEASFNTFSATTGSAALFYSTTVSGSTAPIWDLTYLISGTTYTTLTKVTAITSSTSTTTIASGTTATIVTGTSILKVITTGTDAYTTSVTGTTFSSGTSVVTGTTNTSGTTVVTGTTFTSGTTVTSGTTYPRSMLTGTLTSGSSTIALTINNIVEDRSGKFGTLLGIYAPYAKTLGLPYVDFSLEDGAGGVLRDPSASIVGTMSGAVSSSGTFTRVAMTIETTGTGTIGTAGTTKDVSFTGTLKINGELSRSGSNIMISGTTLTLNESGTSILKTITSTTPITAGELSLPYGINGDWTLTLYLKLSKNKYTGTAVIQTSGQSFDFTATGTYTPAGSKSNITLKGAGTTVNLGMLTSGTNMTLQSFKGKLLGQSLDIKSP